MSRGINLVVTCTKKKLRPVRDTLQLRNVTPALPAESRASRWIERLKKASGNAVSPLSLYGGDHWSVVRELATKDLFGPTEIRIWVCSAGYGLIPLESRIHPYSATFAPGHPDSIACGPASDAAETHAEWWERLAKWEGPSPQSPRTIADLARWFPDDLLLAVLSETYLLAAASDLRATVEHSARRPDRFAVLCSGVREFGVLTPHLLPSDARLQHKVGGVLASLNIRVARLLIDSTTPGEWSQKSLRVLLSAWLAEQPERVRYDREPMSDEDVRREIRRALKADPGVRPTPLLRRIRDSGRACEHSRFVRLFHETAGPTNGKS